MGPRWFYFSRVLYVFTFICSLDATVKHYVGHKVIRMIPKTEAHLKTLRVLRSTDNELDFWTEPAGLDANVDVRVHPDFLEELTNTLLDENIDHSVIIPDVQEAIDRQQDDNKESNKIQDSDETKPTISFTAYHRLEKIHKYLYDLELTYPNMVKVESIGKSYMGKELLVIKIGINKGNVTKPAIWIDAGIHAREWIAPATALYIVDQLTNNYEKHRFLIDEIDWYIHPSVNPDGYEFTHTNDRFWRKTLSRTHKPLCKGVDANRNFAFHYNEGGSSSRPCSEIYRGTKAFSEPETKAMADFLLNHKDSLKVYISLHSYGQVVLTPWAYTYTIPSDYEELHDLMADAMRSMEAVDGANYTIGPVTHLMYVASGSSTDYAKGTVGIKYAYTIELRDTGEHGFLLPASKIIDTGTELWEAIKYIGQTVGGHEFSALI